MYFVRYNQLKRGESFFKLAYLLVFLCLFLVSLFSNSKCPTSKKKDNSSFPSVCIVQYNMDTATSTATIYGGRVVVMQGSAWGNVGQIC